MNKEKLDSFASIARPLNAQEKEWLQLIHSKTTEWNSFRDSLAIPFEGIRLQDSIFVLIGFTGNDDGFTYGDQTVCLDLTALQSAYGSATTPENHQRISRIFAHEYTHLLHKAWAKKNDYAPKTFRDEILWECLYEGIGMYRSLNEKWKPVDGNLPELTLSTLNQLQPILNSRLESITDTIIYSEEEKATLHANLSRGPVHKKWGAFPIAIWLLLEANGNDKNLRPWIEMGPEAVVKLSEKYR